MAPLILHNVPDEELYVGDDGIKRPYAMVFPQQDGLPGSVRARRAVAETGSFGKSTRRSRSRTGTPSAAARSREDPTLAGADKLFGDWISNKAAASSANNTSTNPASTAAPQRKTSGHSILAQDESAPAPASAKRSLSKAEPTEVMLRGYRTPNQQYSAIGHYENLAGRICEDYPREPPPDQRRWKGDLRDPAFTRSQVLTPEEKAKVNRADGGDHWVKITFESREAADAAVYASPQSIQGYLVYAEYYNGLPPPQDEAVPDVDTHTGFGIEGHQRAHSMPGPGFGASGRRGSRGLRTSGLFQAQRSASDLSPPDSLPSSQTMDTATLSQATSRSSRTMSTVTPAEGFENPFTDSAVEEPLNTTTPTVPGPQEGDSIFCSRIPTARRATLRSADEAHLPSQSLSARILAAVPILMWFIGGFGAMIGSEVPRKEDGEFDFDKASLYWRFIWWLDSTFGLFRGEILSASDKED